VTTLAVAGRPVAAAAGAHAPLRRMRGKKPVASGANKAAAPARVAHAACAAVAVAHTAVDQETRPDHQETRPDHPKTRPDLSNATVAAPAAVAAQPKAAWATPAPAAAAAAGPGLARGPRCWSRVGKQLEGMLSVNGAAGAAVVASGAANGSLCRALGCALDTIESLRLYPLPADEGALAVALARYALKYELGGPHLDVALRHFADPRARDVECELLMMMVGRQPPSRL